MSPIVLPSRRRRVVRRSARARCQAVALDGFRLLGHRVLDLSPYGLLVACDAHVDMGEDVVVSFQTPGDGRWYDAEAKVARIIEGWRPGDPGFCIGLEFTAIALEDRLRLHDRLRGTPPPVPARPVRRDYAATVGQIAASA